MLTFLGPRRLVKAPDLKERVLRSIFITPALPTITAAPSDDIHKDNEVVDLTQKLVSFEEARETPEIDDLAK